MMPPAISTLPAGSGDEVLRLGPTGQAAMTVSLSEASASPVTVDFTTSDGTAAAGEDYTAMSGTLTFGAGATTRTILIPTSQESHRGAQRDLPRDTEQSESQRHDRRRPRRSHDPRSVQNRSRSSPIASRTVSGTAKWAEDSQNDWFTSTQRKTDGSYSAEVDGWATDATLTMADPVDMTPYGSAELTFDWYIERGFDSGEYLALDSSPDGSTWTEIARLRGNVDQENAWHNVTIGRRPPSS